MAENTGRKAALIAELERARAEMSAHTRGVRAHTNVSGKLRDGFNRYRTACLGVAALFGLALVPRPKKVVVSNRNGRHIQQVGKAGFALGAVKLALDLTKPLILAWATKRVSDLASSTKKVERKVDRVDAKT